MTAARAARAILGLGLGAAAVVLWVIACTGPDPAVVATDLQEPSSPGEPYIALVTVRNHWRGEGSVEVEVELRDQDGRRYVATETIELPKRAEVVIGIEVPAPEADYELRASAHYPKP